MMKKPPPTTGLRHIALFVRELESCVTFYTTFFDMVIEWQPDADNYYLTSGQDNLALHRMRAEAPFGVLQRLDHIGFIVNDIDDVDVWYEYLKAHQVVLKTVPRTHRDGARSFYCVDPDGNRIQVIYHPPLAR